jgi:uncharacterized protein (DUF433 family)
MLAQAYRYIVSDPNTRSGHAMVEGSRIGVHDVVGLILNGSSIDEALRSFPSLSRAQVYECMAYYEDHKDELDLLIALQMTECAG